MRTRRDVAELSLALGRMLWERGDVAGGLALARRARGLLEPLVASAPSDTDQRLRLHAAYDLLGQMSLEAGEIAQALDFHRADLRALEPTPEAERRRPELRRAISVAYGHLVDAQVEADDLPGALESHTEDLRADPGNRFHRLALAGDHAWICKTLTALAKPEAAAACRETAAFVDATPVEPDHAFPGRISGRSGSTWVRPTTASWRGLRRPQPSAALIGSPR